MTCLLFNFWVDHIITWSVINPKFKKKVVHSSKNQKFIWEADSGVLQKILQY